MTYATAVDLTDLVQGSIDAATAALLIDIAAGAVDAEVGASIEEATYVETFDAWSPARSAWAIRLVPPDWPVAVDSVVEDGVTLTEADYIVRSDGVLVRHARNWSGDVEVTYTTGFVSGDPAFETARRITLQMAARAAANPEHLDSVGLDGTTPSFVVQEGTTAVPPTTLYQLEKRDLEPWRWRRRFA